MTDSIETSEDEAMPWVPPVATVDTKAMTYKLPPLPEWFESASEHLKNDVRNYAIAAIEAQGVPDGWQPIETAPESMDECVVVGWLDDEGLPRTEFDYKEDGCWIKWHEHAEHTEVIGGHGVSYTPPYTHWLKLPPLASAPPAPQAEIVEATQPHPTNNYLFKLLCEKAGIVLGVDRVDTACEKVARMSPCVDSKYQNYWDDAYDDLKPGDIETDCEPAPQDVVGHQSPDPMGDSDKKEQPHKAAGSGLVQSLTTSQERSTL